jgi:biotin operon repressor
MPPSTKLSPEEINRFRSIKKNAIVLMLMIRLNKPVGETELSDKLAMSPKTVRAHLRQLSEAGLIARSYKHEGYILTAYGHQTVLPAPDPPAELPEPAKEEPAATKFEDNSGSDCEIETGKIYRFESSTTTINTSSELKEDITVGVEEKRGETGKNYRFVPDNPPENPPAQGVDPELLEVLQQIGITLNKRTRKLLEKPYITADYVWAHYLALDANGKGRQTGLLITILESGAAAPELNRNKHLADCDCDECSQLYFHKLYHELNDDVEDPKDN